MATARTPARSAAAIWSRMSASSGETSTVGAGAPARSSSVATKYTADLPQPGALHDERPAPPVDERLDRLELPVVEVGVVAADEFAQCGECFGAGAAGAAVDVMGPLWSIPPTPPHPVRSEEYGICPIPDPHLRDEGGGTSSRRRTSCRSRNSASRTCTRRTTSDW